MNKTHLPITGMSCASCVAHVEGALKGVPGVLDVRVNVATEKASVEYGLSLDGLEQRALELSAQGKTPMYVAVNNSVAGVIAVADTLRPESREAVDANRLRNVEPAGT